MKIAICADIHDNIPNTELFVQWCVEHDISLILICGDVGHAETLEQALFNTWSRPVHIVLGNADVMPSQFEFLAQQYNEVYVYKKTAIIELEDMYIGITHFPDEAQGMIDECDVVWYGHTHKPWIETVGSCTLANPGTLAGLYYPATFAVYDTVTRKPELHRIKDR